VKDHLASLVRQAADPAAGRNVAREYLQARILGALQRAGAMIPLAFQGGTCLRFLYHIARYSEDLDFALEQQREDYDFRAYVGAVQGELTAEGYGPDVRASNRRVVHSAFVRFPGLLYELGLSGQRGEVLAVKLEVDTNPPAGALLETTVVRRYELLQLQHHDKPSLLAGKLHAILRRPYSKGRDLFDLVWYLSDPAWPEPNLTLLANALAQKGWQGPRPTTDNWRDLVLGRLEAVDWERARADVRPFLEPPANADIVSRVNALQLLAHPNRDHLPLSVIGTSPQARSPGSTDSARCR